jgi:hypothetical protein
MKQPFDPNGMFASAGLIGTADDLGPCTQKPTSLVSSINNQLQL